MSGAYFETGYIDANYFTGDVTTASATLSAQFGARAQISPIRPVSATLQSSFSFTTDQTQNYFATGYFEEGYFECSFRIGESK